MAQKAPQSAVDKLRARIAARKAGAEVAQKTAKIRAKFATLRKFAADEPAAVDAALTQLGEGFGELAEAIRTLKVNLDLVEAPKTADMKTRIAAKRNYGARFKRIAEEAPEQFEGALNEFYQAIDGLAEDTENLAGNLGVNLSEAPMGQEAPFGGEGEFESEPKEIAEEEHEVVKEHEEEGNAVPAELEEHVEEEEAVEASGSDAWVTDRDEKGEPKKPTLASRKVVKPVK